tara:strand:- start:10902 stop:11978 length:1077 start_codon:yes stop_codon:yes gene_type:complete
MLAFFTAITKSQINTHSKVDTTSEKKTMSLTEDIIVAPSPRPERKNVWHYVYRNPIRDGLLISPQCRSANHEGKNNAQDKRIRPRQVGDQTPSTIRATSIALSNIVQGAIPSAVVVVVVPASSRRAAVTTASKRSTFFATPAVTRAATVVSSSSTMTTVRSESRSSSPTSTVPAPSDSTDAAFDFTPPAPPDEGPLSPFAQLGVSFAVTFSVLFLAAAIAIYIWHRRRALRHNVANNRPSFGECAKKILRLKKKKIGREDPEWSIESAEEVFITRAARAQSISTVSRLDSRGTDGTSDIGERPSGVQRQEMTLALTSRSIISTPAAIKAGLSEAPGGLAQENKRQTKEVKFRSWPLKD